MARFAAWTLALCALAAGCGGGGGQEAAPPARSRVDAVLADPAKDTGLDAFCEVHATATEARTLEWPELDGALAEVDGGWAWYSLWASWCGPCLAELPLMRSWEQRLAADGVPAAIRPVSVDASADDLAAFRAKHDDAPTGPRIADQASVAPWLTGLGLDEGAAIPIHLFVDPAARVRCIRVGAVSESDYSTVKGILGGG